MDRWVDGFDGWAGTAGEGRVGWMDGRTRDD
jgi:hypothetical protein